MAEVVVTNILSLTESMDSFHEISYVLCPILLIEGTEQVYGIVSKHRRQTSNVII